MQTAPFTFGVQVGLESKRGLLDTARQAEAQGFDMLSVADHPGSMASPFPTLAAVAAATESIRLGPYVANAGLRRPLDLAVDTATLDVLSDGRAFLGIGAGHTPNEWSSQGLERPSASARIRRLIETADAVRALLAGDRVTATGEFVTLEDAALGGLRPVQDDVPMLVGGNNSCLLRYAGEQADIVALSGLGRTLADGHRHEVRWSPDEIDAGVVIVDGAAQGRETPPVRQALVQMVEVTADRRAVADDLARRIGSAIDVVLAAPFVLIGTIEEIASQVLVNRERWGITSYVVRQDAMNDIAAVIEALTVAEA